MSVFVNLQMILAVSVKTTIICWIIISHALRIKFCPIVQVTGLELKANTWASGIFVL